MLKETITFMDFDGTERTEDFFFNLSQAEIAEIELSIEGGLVKKIEKMAAAQDGGEIIRMIKEIILDSYGEKSGDGRRFIKSKELSTAFSQTGAYSQLFMRLITNPDAMAAFTKGIIPADLEKKAAG